MSENQDHEIFKPIKPAPVRRLLVFFLAALVNGVGIHSAAVVISTMLAESVLTPECTEHLLATEEHGMRQLNSECNNEYRILVGRLNRHIEADAKVMEMIEQERQERRE